MIPMSARILAACALAFFAASVRAQTADDLEFFEKRVRPILAERCYECHSAEKKVKGGLRLDTREGWEKGGDSGPAIVPGDPEKSRLATAIRWSDLELQMPPKQKLGDAEIKTLEEWIRRGAPDPRSGESKVAAKSPTTHWAYQPIPRASGSIDGLVEKGWKQEGLKPAKAVGRQQLLRRLYFDLTGLPPRETDLSSTRSAEEIVDELLASKRFGEHWARHWFDIVRFAESVTLRGFIFKEAWRYRDYVIGAFNSDRPIDGFLREQIAGDMMESGSLEEKRRRLVATTFLMLGNTNLEEQDKKQLEMDVVDEQIDVIGKAFLGQTISCARCHDHKFDPIPTRDYYALAGILRGADVLKHANVSEWLEQPLPIDPAEEARLKESEKEIAALEAEIKRLKGAAGAKGDVIDPKSLPGAIVDSANAAKVGDWKHSQHNKPYIGDGYWHDDNSGKGAKTLSFQPELPRAGKYEVRLAYAFGESRATNVPVTIFHADGETTIAVDQKKTPASDGAFVTLGQFRFEANGFGHVLVSNEGTRGHVTADAVQFLAVENLGGELASASAPDTKPLEERLRKLKESAPRRPMAMAPREGVARDLPIHIRGSVHQLGEVAPRGFLSAVNVSLRAGQQGHRRIELAEWITHPQNPLTARVFANRVWLWLMGEGLVRTPDNFGTTGEAPTHPELLDYLARRFADQGWSAKKLIREIVLSRTYALASAPNEADPENRFYTRSHRRRLSAEAIRDSMLAIGGELDLSFSGGRSYPEKLTADFGHAGVEPIRSVYLPVFRNALPELFAAFNFPSTSMVAGKRDNSIVATQSLFLMNDPWVRARAEAAARSLAAENGGIELAFVRALGRKPTAKEAEIASAANAADVFHALFASPEFRWID